MTKKRKRTLQKLIKKKLIIVSWLNKEGYDVDEVTDSLEVLRCAYEFLGRKPPIRVSTAGAMNSRYGEIIAFIKPTERHVRQMVEKEDTALRLEGIDPRKFYKSAAWRKVRYQVLKRDNGKCCLCGRSARDGVVLNVDHIKPLRKYWSLRLDPDNLQTLCAACNHGKGNWDETRW